MAIPNPYTSQGIPTVRDSIGSKIGDAFLGGAKAVGAGALWTGAQVGKGVMWGLPKIGQATLSSTKAIGSGIINGAGFLYGITNPKYEDTSQLSGWKKTGAQIRNTQRRMANPTTPIKMLGNFAKTLVDYEPERQVWNETKGVLEKKLPNLKLTGRGKLVVLGAGMIASTMRGSDEHSQRLMGKVDTQTTVATPDYSPREYDTHLDSGGASGDLVFALWRNRHG